MAAICIAMAQWCAPWRRQQGGRRASSLAWSVPVRGHKPRNRTMKTESQRRICSDVTRYGAQLQDRCAVERVDAVSSARVQMRFIQCGLQVAWEFYFETSHNPCRFAANRSGMSVIYHQSNRYLHPVNSHQRNSRCLKRKVPHRRSNIRFPQRRTRPFRARCALRFLASEQ